MQLKDDSILRMLRFIGGLLMLIAMILFIQIIQLSEIIGELQETTPETEVVETTECTTAPVVDIVPETEENIHIETTEIPSEALSGSVSGETISEVNKVDLELLACVIYQEAGGNSSCDDCRRYIADIVLNRVADERFPDSIHEVLTAKDQYGKFYYTGVVWPERAIYDTEKEAVERAYRIAEEVLNGQHSKLYGNGYIWQAGFVQGTDGFWCCGHWYGR